MNHTSSLAPKIINIIGTQNKLDTHINGLTLHRWDHTTEPTSYMLPPSVCLIGQGRKRLYLGDESYVYDANSFLITSVDLPVISHIIQATSTAPYLGLTLELDLKLIAKMMLEFPQPTTNHNTGMAAIAVSHVSEGLLNGFERLLDLLSQPQHIGALAPLINQEIFYRLLISEQGPLLKQIVSMESKSFRIARAIDWLRDNFSKPLPVNELAHQAGLSTSAFYKHFNQVTAMSPVQYQKKMRLNEARHLMLSHDLGASEAAFEVGYESPSQFNREYSRLFGTSPLRDIKKIKQQSTV